jgi:excisionase family DNA binding protein
MSAADAILTAEEVAAELRCSKAHVYNVIAGKVVGVSSLPAIAMGRRKLIRRAALDQWKRTNETCASGGTISASSAIGTVRRIEEMGDA